MVFEKIEKEIYKCNRCRQCRYITEKPLAVIDPETDKVIEHALLPSCPSGYINKFTAYYSSGRLVLAKRAREGLFDLDEKAAEIFYKCSLCSACDFQCSLNMTVSELSKDMEFKPSKIFETIREELVEHGLGPMPQHKKFAENIKTFHNPYGDKIEDRFNWYKGSLKNPKKSEIAYFVGCTSAYRRPEIASATSKILEKSGTNFTLLPEEWCCGSPLLRTGQRKLAENLVKHNVELIEKMGVNEIVVSCAGCYSTIRNDYPEIAGKLGFNVVHITEYIDRMINEGKLKLEEIKSKVTYHDPCHLGRQLSVYDSPRNILKAIPGLKFKEMLRIRKNSWCCGAGGGVMSAFPDMATKSADIRLEEAMNTGSEILISSCPFCKHNLARAAETFGRKIQILDITEFVSKALPDK